MKNELPKKARKSIKQAMLRIWQAGQPGITVSINEVGNQKLIHLYYVLNHMDCELNDLGPEFVGKQMKLTVQKVKIKTADGQPVIVT